jgi:hypothetical protein
MNWLYLLENPYQPPFTDTAFPFLIGTGSRFYFENYEYEVISYLPLDEHASEEFDDADFCVYCNLVRDDFDYTLLLRQIKLDSLGI